MKPVRHRGFIYSLLLSLWIGGIAVVTFLVTPVIFASFGRDTAGEIVGKILPRYFTFNLAVSVLTFLSFISLRSGIGAGMKKKIVLGLLAAAVIVNLFISFRLYPEIVRVKQQVASFESVPPDALPRKEFRRLHGISSILNLLLLADGIALLAFMPEREL